jgi:hypothetical protein
MAEEIDKTPKNEYNKKGHYGFVAGNPGKPKGAFSLIALLRSELQQVPEGEKRTHALLIIQKWIKKAELGDMQAISRIAAYTDGMPKQVIEGLNTEPIKLVIVKDKDDDTTVEVAD